MMAFGIVHVIYQCGEATLLYIWVLGNVSACASAQRKTGRSVIQPQNVAVYNECKRECNHS